MKFVYDFLASCLINIDKIITTTTLKIGAHSLAYEYMEHILVRTIPLNNYAEDHLDNIKESDKKYTDLIQHNSLTLLAHLEMTMRYIRDYMGPKFKEFQREYNKNHE